MLRGPQFHPLDTPDVQTPLPTLELKSLVDQSQEVSSEIVSLLSKISEIIRTFLENNEPQIRTPEDYFNTLEGNQRRDAFRQGHIDDILKEDFGLLEIVQRGVKHSESPFEFLESLELLHLFESWSDTVKIEYAQLVPKLLSFLTLEQVDQNVNVTLKALRTCCRLLFNGREEFHRGGLLPTILKLLKRGAKSGSVSEPSMKSFFTEISDIVYKMCSFSASFLPNDDKSFCDAIKMLMKAISFLLDSEDDDIFLPVLSACEFVGYRSGFEEKMKQIVEPVMLGKVSKIVEAVGHKNDKVRVAALRVLRTRFLLDEVETAQLAMDEGALDQVGSLLTTENIDDDTNFEVFLLLSLMLAMPKQADQAWHIQAIIDSKILKYLSNPIKRKEEPVRNFLFSFVKRLTPEMAKNVVEQAVIKSWLSPLTNVNPVEEYHRDILRAVLPILGKMKGMHVHRTRAILQITSTVDIGEFLGDDLNLLDDNFNVNVNHILEDFDILDLGDDDSDDDQDDDDDIVIIDGQLLEADDDTSDED